MTASITPIISHPYRDKLSLDIKPKTKLSARWSATDYATRLMLLSVFVFGLLYNINATVFVVQIAGIIMLIISPIIGFTPYKKLMTGSSDKTLQEVSISKETDCNGATSYFAYFDSEVAFGKSEAGAIKRLKEKLRLRKVKNETYIVNINMD